MSWREHVWALLLACDRERPVPEDASPASGARELAESLLPASRILVVTGPARSTCGELQGLPADNVLVQPAERGTAVGLLLGVLHLLERQGHGARLVVVPGRSCGGSLAVMRTSLRDAIEASHDDAECPVLLGVTPVSVGSWEHWIVASPSGTGPARPVLGLMDRPDRATACHLLARGAGLLNSLILVSTVDALLRLYEWTLPALLDAAQVGPSFGTPVGSQALRAAYGDLPSHDLLRDVLEPACQALAVLPVPPAPPSAQGRRGVSDLGAGLGARLGELEDTRSRR